MIIEIKFICAGAVALIAQSVGAKIDDVFVGEYSVTMWLDEDLVENRILVEECQRKDLMFKWVDRG